MDQLIPIILFVVAGFVIMYYFMTRSKERQLLIEKDIEADDLKKLFFKPKVRYGTARVALIFLFGGVGLFIGIWLSEQTGEDGYIPAAIVVSIGLGLLVWQKLYGDGDPEED